MAEKIDGKTVFSLFEVTRSIQKTLNARYGSAFWVKAELNKLNFYEYSGHCYPDLVEKRDGKTIAQIRSILWKSHFRRINEDFKRILGEPLKDGIKILLYAKINFDSFYGLSLNILDIDPSYTLGDLQREKQEAIDRLKKERIFDHNKRLKLPLLPRRIAVISVETSNGYADFLNVFNKATQEKGYQFFQMLFRSKLQGDGAVSEMIAQLRKIKKVRQHFDLVTIVRGGGGDIGLSCYNHYELAREIALFPIPVLTGIGHSTNETVAEMVAFENAITPTKLAEMIVAKYDSFWEETQRAKDKIVDFTKRALLQEKNNLNQLMRHFRAETQKTVYQNKGKLNENLHRLLHQAKFTFSRQNHLLFSLSDQLKWGSKAFLRKEDGLLRDFGEGLKKDMISSLQAEGTAIAYQQRQLNKGAAYFLENQSLALQGLEKDVRIMNPINVLKRGYSISLLAGKALTDAQQAKPGDIVQTLLYKGELQLKVEENNLNKNENDGRNELYRRF